MAKIPDRFGLLDLLRRPDLARDLLRGHHQLKNLQYVLGSGEVRRGVFGKAIDGTVNLGDIATGVSAIQPPTIVENNPWSDAAVAAGGCVTPVAIQIAEATHRAIEATTFASKIIMLWPFLGCNIVSACVPLIDRLGRGIATNHGFVDADFSQSLGIQGNGSTKYIDSLVKPGDLGTSNAGGIGWMERNVSLGGSTNVEPIGSYLNGNVPDNRFSLDLRSTSRAFRWGAGGNPGQGVAAINASYYGQSPNASTRDFFIDGARVATDTSVTTTTANDLNMLLMGCNCGAIGIKPWGGLGFYAYMTDGTMTDAEYAAFYSLLQTYLVNPKIAGVPVQFGAGAPQGTFPDPTDPANAEEDDCNACVNRILVSASGEVLVSRTGKVLLSSNAET